MFGAPDYETPTHGSNGTFTGVLNMPGALKDGYNAAQASGRGLPEEEDLPGTGIRAVSGAPVPAPHETTGGSSHSSQAAAATPAKCAVLATRTAVRAQGLC
jgi:hypothetical protein